MTHSQDCAVGMISLEKGNFTLKHSSLISILSVKSRRQGKKNFRMGSHLHFTYHFWNSFLEKAVI